MAFTGIVQNNINAWTTGTRYEVGTVVMQSGYAITCLVAHKSGTYATDVQSGYWQLTSSANNYVVNSNFDVWQRGTSFAQPADWGPDRWGRSNFQAAVMTRQAFSASGVHPGNSTYVCRFAGDGVNNNWITVGTPISNADTVLLRGKSVSLSMYVRFSAASWSVSPVSFTFSIGYTSAAADQSFSTTAYNANGTATKSFTQGSLPTVWTKVTLTLNIPTNANNICVLGAAGTSAIYGAGDYFEVSQVMLNEGSAPAQYQTTGNDANTEKALCGRPDNSDPLGYDRNLGIHGGPVTVAARNHIVNGNMDIWQRGTSFSGTGYSSDRWHATVSGTCTHSRDNSDVPTGSQYNHTWTTGAASSYGQIRQYIEGSTVYSLRGKVVTLSWMAKCNATFSGNVVIEAGYSTVTDTIAGFASTALSIIASSGQIVSTGWTKCYASFIVPTNAVGLYVGLVPTVVQASGAIVRMAQVMLNEGSAPAPFQLAGGNIAGELAMCQRYYEKSYDLATTPGTNLGDTVGNGKSESLYVGANISTFIKKDIRYKAQKRKSTPTMYIYDVVGNGGTGAAMRLTEATTSGANTNNITPSAVYADTDSSFTINHTLTARAGINFCWVADAEL